MKNIEKIILNKKDNFSNNFLEETKRNNSVYEFLKEELWSKIKKENFIVYNKILFLDVSPAIKTIYIGKKKSFNSLMREKFDLINIKFN